MWIGHGKKIWKLMFRVLALWWSEPIYPEDIITQVDKTLLSRTNLFLTYSTTNVGIKQEYYVKINNL